MFEFLDHHFSLLDNADISEESVFKSEHNKERYETLLMYALRKLYAANYHKENVIRFIEKEKEISDYEKPKDAPANIDMSFRAIKPADEYVYELSAFLEALKSCVDLLAEVCSFYLPGIEINYSIRPLIKLVSKGRSGPIFDEVQQNMQWLLGLRDYRHYLVHRLMPTISTGYVSVFKGGRTASDLYHVVVPESTPSYYPDTRVSRNNEMNQRNQIDDNVLPGLTVGKSVVMQQREDGMKEVLAIELNVTPASGYKLINEFMNEHISRCYSFFNQILQAFETLNFRPVKKKVANSG